MQLPRSIAAKATLLVLGANYVSAFWRMPCKSRSGLARIDPLVSKGSLSEHAHAIHGSSGFSADAGYGELMGGECTSCEVIQDKSAYWTPALYFKDAGTGELELVNQVGGMLVYYLLYPNAGNDSLTAFPAGFEMIAGDTNLRNFSNYPVPDIEKSNWNGVYKTQAFLRQAALGFNCLNYKKTPEGTLYRHFMPDKAYLDENCSEGIRFELMFPSCWNRDAGIAPKNKKDHVAYPSQVMTGECPDGFKERLPSMLYETIWDTNAFKSRPGEFIISNGDPTGYGYHGDFMMGWDEKFLQRAVNECTNLSGEIRDCPLFTLQGEDKYSNCGIKLPNVISKEKVVGGLAQLPGNPAINYGPAPAVPGGPAPIFNKPTEAAPPAPVPTLSYSAGSSLASTESYVPGGIFVASTEPAPAPSPVATIAEVAPHEPAVTPAPSVEAEGPPKKTRSFFSTEYKTKGTEVEEILWVEEVVTVTSPATTTILVPGKKRRHLHQHQARHAHH